jgi:hypothetical protein
MKTKPAPIVLSTTALFLATAFLLLTGCGTGFAPTSGVQPALQTPLHGSVHGGQQPISGATIALYIGAVNGYAKPLQNILTKPVSSGTGGEFDITSDYSCVPGQQLYITATGGTTGSGINANSALMAALGDCSNLTPSTFISVNEVTTVGSVFALAPFMSGATALGTSANNIAGLTRAFASVHKLVNIANGSAPGEMLPPGAKAPAAEINTLANLLAACINSLGVADPASPCGPLFAMTTPIGGTTPTDTIGAALAVAQNPTLNVAALFNIIPPQSPFGPTLSTAPTDWTLAINYTVGGFNKPSTTTVDNSGNIWVANSGNNTVTVLTQAGTPAFSAPLTGDGLRSPTGIAIDAGGNAWVTNSTASSVSAFSATGTALANSPFTAGGISLPVSLAFDATGNLWIANSGNNSVSELSATGIPIQQIGNAATPSAIAIDPK